MKRVFFYVFLLSFALFGCESDDICAERVITPRLIVRVYDAVNTNQPKSIPNLLIVGQGSTDAIAFQTSDSLVLPLKMRDTETKFVLVKNAVVDANGVVTAGEQTTLKVTYTTEETFLNKGCGYRTTYKNISVTPELPSWITDVRVLSNDLKNEDKATVHIYY